MNQTFSIFE